MPNTLPLGSNHFLKINPLCILSKLQSAQSYKKDILKGKAPRRGNDILIKRGILQNKGERKSIYPASAGGKNVKVRELMIPQEPD